MLQAVPEARELWDIPPIPTAAILLSGTLYLCGWLRARRTRPIELPPWRAWTFLSGLFVLFLAIASPIDTLADDSLLVHMTQHILLMSIVPPLIVLGAPLVPMLRGLPRGMITSFVGPLMRVQSLRRFAQSLAQPIVTLALMSLVFLGWHIPVAYELALRSEGWHNVEHLCFLASSILFWWKILQPWPARRPWSPWTKLACLLGADVVNTALSAYLSFCGQVIYPSYEHSSHIFGLSALADQSAAGAAMWVINSSVFLIPAMIIPLRALAPSFTRRMAGMAPANPQEVPNALR